MAPDTDTHVVARPATLKKQSTLSYLGATTASSFKSVGKVIWMSLRMQKLAAPAAKVMPAAASAAAAAASAAAAAQDLQSGQAPAEAVQLFEKHAPSKAGKSSAKPGRSITKEKAGMLNAANLLKLVEAMQVQRRLFFTTAAERSTFVDDELARHDAGGDGFLDFDEYLKFYERHLAGDQHDALERARAALKDIEFAFVRCDRDGNMALDASDLRRCAELELQPGVPGPSDVELDQLTSDLLSEYDADGDKALWFPEFRKAYAQLCRRVKELQQGAEAALQDARGFDSLIDDDDLEDEDAEELEKAIRGRYEGRIWVVRDGELGGPQPNGNALERAAKMAKVPLLLKHPSAPADAASQYFSKAGAKVIDVQLLLVDMSAEATPGQDASRSEEAVKVIRQGLRDCWRDGKVCVLRLGKAAPDFSLAWNAPQLLPVDFLDPSQSKPGEALSADIRRALAGNAKGRNAAKSAGPTKDDFVAPGFALVLTSDYSMHTYQKWLKGRLPLGLTQAMQVCASRSEVAAVLRDPSKAVPDEDAKNDAKMQAMDALADML